MQKNVLVSSLGKTPAVVTEMVDLLEERGIPIHEVVIFPARNVLSSYYVLLADFKYGPYRGEKRIEKRELSFDDVRDERKGKGSSRAWLAGERPCLSTCSSRRGKGE